MNEAYFVKIASNDGSVFFLTSIVHEINVYKQFNGKENIPVLLYSHVDSTQAILVLGRIQGYTLAQKRDAFMIGEQINKAKLLSQINEVAKWPIPSSWKSSYNRDEKLDSYLKQLSSLLPDEDLKKLERLRGTLHRDCRMSLSHGDLLPMNIIQSDNHYAFLDWEWAGVRPASFDPVVFILFAGEPIEQIDTFAELTTFWEEKELYRDALIVGLREMKNGMHLHAQIKKEEAINRWKQVVQRTLRKLEA